MYHALITYDGTNYFGWQKTKSGPSIQEEIEIALQKITGQKTQPEAASRTDRGVHAIGQVVQFACQTHLTSDDLKRALNAVLPQDIKVLELYLKDFHPTLDSIGKEYIYKFSPVPVQDPTIRLYSWHLRYPIDFAPMKKAAAHLVGSHDFTSFANNKEKDPNCKIEDISIYPDYISIKGDRFLYKMVRNLVGTLIYVGYGKIHPSDIPRILAAKDRKLAGITAPAHGLYLHQVFYLIN